MCRAMEELIAKDRLRELAKERTKIAQSLWKYGIRDVEQIASLTNLTVEDVKKALVGIDE